MTDLFALGSHPTYIPQPTLRHWRSLGIVAHLYYRDSVQIKTGCLVVLTWLVTWFVYSSISNETVYTLSAFIRRMLGDFLLQMMKSRLRGPERSFIINKATVDAFSNTWRYANQFIFTLPSQGAIPGGRGAHPVFLRVYTHDDGLSGIAWLYFHGTLVYASVFSFVFLVSLGNNTR